jgi:hypothetical protein
MPLKKSNGITGVILHKKKVLENLITHLLTNPFIMEKSDY